MPREREIKSTEQFWDQLIELKTFWILVGCSYH